MGFLNVKTLLAAVIILPLLRNCLLAELDGTCHGEIPWYSTPAVCVPRIVVVTALEQTLTMWGLSSGNSGRVPKRHPTLVKLQRMSAEANSIGACKDIQKSMQHVDETRQTLAMFSQIMDMSRVPHEYEGDVNALVTQTQTLANSYREYKEDLNSMLVTGKVVIENMFPVLVEISQVSRCKQLLRP